MYYIFSPTKEMKENTLVVKKSIPKYMDSSLALIDILKQYSVEQIASLMKVNDKIAQLNYLRYHQFKGDNNGVACINMYNGLQFKQLSLMEYKDESLLFMNDHIRILSGLYGVLKPFDSIYPYRLEMQCRGLNLVFYWESKIKDYFQQELIIDVASKEYSEVLKGYKNIIHLYFKVKTKEGYRMQSTQVKIQRGRFLDYIIKNKIDTLEGIKQYCEDEYQFDEVSSDKNNYNFIRR